MDISELADSFGINVDLLQGVSNLIFNETIRNPDRCTLTIDEREKQLHSKLLQYLNESVVCAKVLFFLNRATHSLEDNFENRLENDKEIKKLAESIVDYIGNLFRDINDKLQNGEEINGYEPTFALTWVPQTCADTCQNIMAFFAFCISEKYIDWTIDQKLIVPDIFHTKVLQYLTQFCTYITDNYTIANNAQKLKANKLRITNEHNDEQLAANIFRLGYNSISKIRVACTSMFFLFNWVSKKDIRNAWTMVRNSDLKKYVGKTRGHLQKSHWYFLKSDLQLFLDKIFDGPLNMIKLTEGTLASFWHHTGFRSGNIFTCDYALTLDCIKIISTSAGKRMIKVILKKTKTNRQIGKTQSYIIPSTDDKYDPVNLMIVFLGLRGVFKPNFVDACKSNIFDIDEAFYKCPLFPSKMFNSTILFNNFSNLQGDAWLNELKNSYPPYSFNSISFRKGQGYEEAILCIERDPFISFEALIKQLESTPLWDADGCRHYLFGGGEGFQQFMEIYRRICRDADKNNTARPDPKSLLITLADYKREYDSKKIVITDEQIKQLCQKLFDIKKAEYISKRDEITKEIDFLSAQPVNNVLSSSRLQKLKHVDAMYAQDSPTAGQVKSLKKGIKCGTSIDIKTLEPQTWKELNAKKEASKSVIIDLLGTSKLNRSQIPSAFSNVEYFGLEPVDNSVTKSLCPISGCAEEVEFKNWNFPTHVKNHFDTNEVPKCRICGQSCSTASKLMHHLKHCHSLTKQCENCGILLPKLNIKKLRTQCLHLVVRDRGDIAICFKPTCECENGCITKQAKFSNFMNANFLQSLRRAKNVPDKSLLQIASELVEILNSGTLPSCARKLLQNSLQDL